MCIERGLCAASIPIKHLRNMVLFLGKALQAGFLDYQFVTRWPMARLCDADYVYLGMFDQRKSAVWQPLLVAMTAFSVMYLPSHEGEANEFLGRMEETLIRLKGKSASIGASLSSSIFVMLIVRIVGFIPNGWAKWRNQIQLSLTL